MAPDELPQVELPQAMPAPRGRSDAVRNRAAILEAAERLLCEHGPEAITMDRLADEAGVGKGTLFRRFGDRASLFHALLDESEQRLQESFIRGPAPLGPGAPPVERLIAFGHALIDLTLERGPLLLAALPAAPGLRFRSPVYAAYRAHVRNLLELTGTEDAEYLADVVLGALAPELILQQVENLGAERCRRGFSDLIRASSQR